MIEQENKNNAKLLFIKTIHTIIWAFFVSVIAFIVYAGVTDMITQYVWMAIGLVVFEGILLLANSGKCPLTPIAARYTESAEDNFDIFLPKWLARNNKLLFTTIFAIGVVLVLWRVAGS
jgi:hypothetical protein